MQGKTTNDDQGFLHTCGGSESDQGKNSKEVGGEPENSKEWHSVR